MFSLFPFSSSAEGQGDSAPWSRFFPTQGRLRFQTVDHNVAQAGQQISAAKVRNHGYRNRLLHSLGNGKPPRPTLPERPITLLLGDAFLLCSDGLWEYTTEAEMQITLAKAAGPAKWLNANAAILLDHASLNHDNYSGIAVCVAAGG